MLGVRVSSPAFVFPLSKQAFFKWVLPVFDDRCAPVSMPTFNPSDAVNCTVSRSKCRGFGRHPSDAVSAVPSYRPRFPLGRFNAGKLVNRLRRIGQAQHRVMLQRGSIVAMPQDSLATSSILRFSNSDASAFVRRSAQLTTGNMSISSSSTIGLINAIRYCAIRLPAKPRYLPCQIGLWLRVAFDQVGVVRVLGGRGALRS